MGHKNSDKVPIQRVVSMADEPIIMPRKPHAQTVRPCQWHITRGGPAVEKEFRRGSQS